MKNFKYVICVLLIPAFIACSRKGDIHHEEEEIIELDTPTGLKVDGYTDNSVKMSWDGVDKAREYSYRLVAKFDTAKEKEDSVVANGKTAGLFKTIWDLDYDCTDKGFQYWFSVCAVSGKSSSDYCDAIRIEPGGCAPSIPSGVRLESYTDRGLTFIWSDALYAERYGYILTNTNNETIYSGECAQTSITFDSLKKGRYYYFQVKSLGSEKYSLFCEPVEGLTSGAFIPAMAFNVAAPDYIVIDPNTSMNVYDGTGDASYITKDGGRTAVFEVLSEYEPEEGAEYTIRIPEELDQAILPSAYAYADNVFHNLPMWAKSSGNEVSANSYMGILSLSVTSDTDAVLEKLTVRADKDICGAIKSHSEEAAPYLTVEGGKEVSIKFPEGLHIGQEAKNIYIPMPEGSYSSVSVEFVSGGRFPVKQKTEPFVIESNRVAVQTMAVNLPEEAPKTFTVSLKTADGWPFVEGILAKASQSFGGDEYHLNQNGMTMVYGICRGATNGYQYIDASRRMQLKSDSTNDPMLKWIRIPGMGGRFISSLNIENTRASSVVYTFKKSLDSDAIGSVTAAKSTTTTKEMKDADGEWLMGNGEDLYLMMTYNTLYYITLIEITYSADE